ncbi:MAG: nuclear transport factor 2 family protein [Cyclobacteriaceae bacterium]|nr:nuclear transport factor 2 family protein [Cyclobacteriaceae bacterium]
MKTLTHQPESMDVLSKKGTCIEFFSAYQDFDLDRMLGLCSADGQVAFEPLGDGGKGKIHELGKGIWAALMEAFPNLDNTVKSQTYNEADNSVSCIVTIFGKQEKAFAEIPSKGNEFDSEHIFIFRFNEGGEITNLSVNWNHEAFVKQLTGA